MQVILIYESTLIPMWRKYDPNNEEGLAINVIIRITPVLLDDSVLLWVQQGPRMDYLYNVEKDEYLYVCTSTLNTSVKKVFLYSNNVSTMTRSENRLLNKELRALIA